MVRRPAAKQARDFAAEMNAADPRRGCRSLRSKRANVTSAQAKLTMMNRF
jgi:hypothetical protein